MMNAFIHRRIRAAASFAVLIPCLLAGTGCARIAVGSEVHTDGSLTRTVVYSGTSPEAPKPDADVSLSPRLEDLVALPTAAGGWKITRTRDEKSNVTVTATRRVAPGQTVRNDLGVRLPKPKTADGTATALAAPSKPPVRTAQIVSPSALLLENTATVRQITPGRLEYREVLHWRGARPKELDTPDPEMMTELRRALPASLNTDTAGMKEFGVAMQRELWKIMFGPGDPVLPLVVFHQDLAEYRIQKALRGAVRRSLTGVYGSRISANDLETAVAGISAAVASSATKKNQAKKDAGPGGMSADSRDDNNTPVALFIRVKMPGKISQTNGEWDTDTNEVVWPLYPEAAALGDITLTATTDVSPPK